MIMRCLSCRVPHDAAGSAGQEMVLICVGGSQFVAVCPRCRARSVYVELGDSRKMPVFDNDREFEESVRA